MSSRPDRHAAEHALAIAALQAGDLAGAELARAEAIRDSCAACAALYADLETLRTAVRAMPMPPRRRDYRLSEADAARLRPSTWRRLVAWLAAPGSTVRPLATGLATLGLAGLILASLPGLPILGSGAAAPAPAYQVTMGPADAEMTPGGPVEPSKAGGGGQAAPSQVPVPTAAPVMVVPGSPVAAPSPGEGITGAGEADGTATGSVTPDERSRNVAEAARLGNAGATGPSLAALASMALLVAGLGLFGARWAARRARS